MKERLTIVFLLAVAASVSFQCSKDEQLQPGDTPSPCMFLGVDTCRQKAPGLLVVDLAATKQTIHSFGASDCWTAKFIGQWADAGKKNKIADLLFSTDTLADGTPVGIGLSLWRFNIGAGSYEQGDTSNIVTDWRREECFQNRDGSYDWSKQQGAQWFLEAARARGVRYTLGFSLSPPVHMTLNGKAFNGTAGTNLNIQDGRLGDYADFLVAVSEHFGFDYLSPVNEPQWQWGKNDQSSQEGTQATNAEIANLCKLLSSKFSPASPTGIVVAEA
ncbi:MAG TPA: glycoside hydrolase, partial [Chryseosolibacter sp.]